MTHGSLYTGIGGWLLAAFWAGIENIFTCEIDPFCNKVIDKRFPEIPKENRHGNIKEMDFTKYRGTIDILSTSDPCQPFSFAGKRKGKADDRFLWPQTIRAVRESQPAYVVFENVPGFISLGFETVTSDLEAEGYQVESFIIPACAVGAWHRRDRLWIIAHTMYDRDRQQMESGGKCKNEFEFKKPKSRTQYSEQFNELDKSTRDKGEDVSDTNRTRSGTSRSRTDRYGQKKNKGQEGQSQSESCGLGKDVPNPTSQGSEGNGYKTGQITGPSYWDIESGICRVADGIPSRVDRLKSLGNSIVPQIAYIIFEAIKQVNDFNELKKEKGL